METCLLELPRNMSVKELKNIFIIIAGTTKISDELGLIVVFVIKEIIANQGVRSWHPGRQRRRKTKSTHLKITLESAEQKETKKQEKK